MMELAVKKSFLTVLCFSVLVLCPFVRGGCNDWNETECFTSFGSFFALELEEKIESDPGAAVQLICSSEGKSKIGCVLDYMKDCPELLSGPGSAGNPMKALANIPGFDLQRIVKEGLDAFCSIIVDPCSELRYCFEMPHDGPTGGMAKQDTSSSINYYMLFQLFTGTMCGPMMTCVMKAMEQCPPSIEAEFLNSLKMSMLEVYRVMPYEDTKRFIKEECPKLPKGFSEDTCTMGVYVSENFTMCNENVTMQYTLDMNCEVHDLSKQCIKENVQPKCGEEIAMYLVKNAHMIFPGIPNDCDKDGSGSDDKDVSGSDDKEISGNDDKDVSGSDVKRTSFGILLIATLLTLLIYK